MRPGLRVAATTTAVVLLITPSVPRAQSDLDAFMKQVLTRRDDNWKKLQQYTLEEDETLQVSAPNGRRLYGFRREYTWYPNDEGVFVRSPISADGVKVSEEDRRTAEASWIRQERSREQRRQAEAKDDPAAHGGGDGETAPGLEDLVRPGNEPRFVSSAYFMKFKFDEGSYAFAGREKLLGRDVLKIEYYPHQYFRDPPDADARRTRKDDLGDRIERKMDKVSMVTLWIEPAGHQILQYEFTNIDFDFLPARSLFRVDRIRAAMRMREAFPQVWLPDSIDMSFGMTLALGDVGARYAVKYHDYRLADVRARVR